ncbi:MAG: META domain-containing protein [Chloroflexi bacterium]|nr:MAG: META domain-containing protein [Chloroflexota bacterium]MBL1194439.1 META domain-containing protein [Chloroflexota bacterium]NOH11727.1 META domain-containing protein [Chloroflexota bacterium]
MKQKNIVLSIMAVGLLFLSACANTTNSKTVYIGSVQVACEGVAPQQCLLYKESPEDEYSYLYDGIEGFEFEAGFTHELLITEENVDNPPADGSSILRKLVEVVSKTEAQLPAELANTNWQLVSMDGNALMEGSSATLRFDGNTGEINGNASCNQFFGQAAIASERVYMSGLGMTMMACEEDINQQEITYMAALQNVQSYTIDEGQLHLQGSEGELIFDPQ